MYIACLVADLLAYWLSDVTPSSASVAHRLAVMLVLLMVGNEK